MARSLYQTLERARRAAYAVSCHEMAVVVIPTRNRADLAMNAIQSVLREPVNNLHLIVSDNSTIDDARSALATFCRQLSDPRLLYLAPLEPLLMAKHWDWAMSQALQRYDASHFIYLTDRSLFKPGELVNIIRLARQHPEKVICYDWVTIFDHLRPILVERQPQTGRLVEVSAERLLLLSSKSIFPRCLPRMMNCSVPRSVIEQIRGRFGNVFASVSPDYNFCYRCLDLVDSVIYYDSAAYVSYAIPRSNAGYAVGISTQASKDFLATLELGGRRRNYATPVPAFETGINYIAHEYCLLQRESAKDKFPKLRGAHYLVRNVQGIFILLANKLPLSVRGVLISLRTRMRKILKLQWPTIAQDETSPGFESIGDAINYAVNVPPNEAELVPHLDLLQGDYRR